MGDDGEGNPSASHVSADGKGREVAEEKVGGCSRACSGPLCGGPHSTKDTHDDLASWPSPYFSSVAGIVPKNTKEWAAP